MKQCLLVALLLWFSANPAAASDAPPTPFLDWGACPFECCVYREWSAVRESPVLSQRRHSSETAFVVAAGDKVTALTGVVVTTKPGRIVATAPIRLGEHENIVSLKAGDTLFLLRPMGEGFGRYWFRGRIVALELFPEAIGPVPDRPQLRVLALPSTEWWVKLRNKSGQVGWSARAEEFTNNDSCG